MKKIIGCILLLILVLSTTSCSVMEHVKDRVADVEEEEEMQDSDENTQEKNEKVESVVYSAQIEPLEESVLAEDEIFFVGLAEVGYLVEGWQSSFYEDAYFVDGKGKLLAHFESVEIIGAAPGIISLDQQFFIGSYVGDAFVFRTFDPRSMTFTEEPMYLSMMLMEEGTYSVTNLEGKRGVINQQGDVLLPFEFSEDGYMMKANNYLIYTDFSGPSVSSVWDITTGKKLFEAPYQFGEVFGEYIAFYDPTYSYIFYDASGNPVTIQEGTDVQYSMNYAGANHADRLISNDANHYTIYDENLYVLVELDLDANQYLMAYDELYSITRDGESTYYTYGGEMKVTEKGLPYNQWSEDYLFRQEAGKMYVLNTLTNESTVVDGKVPYSYVVDLGDYFGVNYYDTVSHTLIYNMKGEQLTDQEIEWASFREGYITCQAAFEYSPVRYQAYYTVIDPQGKVLYSSAQKEAIYFVRDDLILAYRGNFVGIMTLDEKWIFRTIPGTM